MSIDFPGIPSSVAGTPLAQSKGPKLDRVREEIQARERLESARKTAEAAAGVGPADGEDHHAAQRDADGRQPSHDPPRAEQDQDPADEPLIEDPQGQRGRLLDLSG